jgi:hypothetical protein
VAEWTLKYNKVDFGASNRTCNISVAVPEWSIGAVCKTAARTGYVGSNPTRDTSLPVLPKFYKVERRRIKLAAERPTKVNNQFDLNIKLPNPSRNTEVSNPQYKLDPNFLYKSF